jgi:hypothetical protein
MDLNTNYSFDLSAHPDSGGSNSAESGASGDTSQPTSIDPANGKTNRAKRSQQNWPQPPEKQPSEPIPVVTSKRGGQRTLAGRVPALKEIDQVLDDDEPDVLHVHAAGEPGAKPQNAGGGSRPSSQVQVLLNLARDVTLFHSADGRPYAKVFVPKQEAAEIAEHHQILAVRFQPFKSWLLMAYLRQTGTAPPTEALTTAIRTLDAKACLEGRGQPVSIRVGSLGDCHYVDLCDAAWRVVEISASGWKVLDESPIAFRRTSGMQALPAPVPGGSLSFLRKYVNTASDEDFLLLVVWLLASLLPTGPYPVLMIQGEQGSAKSTASRVLRLLIDPHSTPLRSEPKSLRDLMVTANASWLIALDNLSGVWAWLSDALCRLATGGGFATRSLYSDEDETHFNAMRPILLNGIDDVADRPDLLDRAILLRLPAIPENQRQEESKFWSKFGAERAQILGALLDVFAAALRALPDVQLEKMPRLADFARFGEAVCQSQGWGEGAFLKAYRNNIEGVTESAAEASPVATAILKLMDELKQDEWQGTVTQLLAKLTPVNEREAKTPGWPGTPRKLTSELIRLAPVLRRLGIFISRPDRTNKGRQVILSKIPPPASSKAPPQQALLALGLEKKRSSGDGSCDEVPAKAATVTGPSQNGHTDNSLSQAGLEHLSDGRDGRVRSLSNGPEQKPDLWAKEATWTL